MATRDRAFYEALDQSGDVTAQMPALSHVRTATFTDDLIYILSCDHIYWTHFAKALVRSIVATAPKAQIHLHVIDATPNQCAAICAFADTLTGVTIAVSAETSPFFGDPRAPEYYQAVRFVRLHQLLEMYRKPLCIMDVDGLMNRDLRPELAAYHACDLTLRVHPTSLQPWQRFYAGAVVVWPTERGRHFARLVAAFIAHFYREGYLPSGIDQFALYAVYGHLAATGSPVRLSPLSGAVVDDFSDPASCLWLQTGRRKWLKSGEAHDIGDDSRYAAVFRRFSD